MLQGFLGKPLSRKPFKALLVLVALLTFAAACGTETADDTPSQSADSDDQSFGATTETKFSDTTITLITHDSFVLSPSTLAQFTRETGIKVEQLAIGDTGVLVAQSILNKDNPLGDVLYGIDNTFLARALNEDIFVPYQSPALDNIDPDLVLEIDEQYRVTPIDYGDVCVNYWTNRFDIGSYPPTPTSLDDLRDPAYANQLVVQNPETSSPGLAFLLATIARFGDGWEQYWADLRANGVTVTSDWNSAYNGEFLAGDGDLPLVVSYASSPPATAMFAEGPAGLTTTGVITDTCFRQIEYAGILAGTTEVAASQELIDFMLSPRLQSDIPLNMFVYPVVEGTELPQVFVDNSAVPEDPLILSSAEIEANRDAWTQRWVEIVLR